MATYVRGFDRPRLVVVAAHVRSPLYLASGFGDLGRHIGSRAAHGFDAISGTYPESSIANL